LIAIGGGIGVIWAFGQEFGVIKSEVSRNSVEIRDIQVGQVARDDALSSKLTTMRLEAKNDNQQTRSEILELRKELGGKMDRLFEMQR